MPEFAVNVRRTDPYKNYKFRVIIDGNYVTGVTKVSPLRRTTEVIALRRGTEQSMERKTPGLTRYEPVVIERGLTHDQIFERWASQVWNLNAGAGQEASSEYRKDIIIELYNESGQVVMSYKLLRAWPSEYTAMPELDAEGNEVAVESLRLENEGWVRDTATQEPKEPSY